MLDNGLHLRPGTLRVFSQPPSDGAVLTCRLARRAEVRPFPVLDGFGRDGGCWQKQGFPEEDRGVPHSQVTGSEGSPWESVVNGLSNMANQETGVCLPVLLGCLIRQGMGKGVAG